MQHQDISQNGGTYTLHKAQYAPTTEQTPRHGARRACVPDSKATLPHAALCLLASASLHTSDVRLSASSEITLHLMVATFCPSPGGICPVMADLDGERSAWVCRANPEALAWTVEALSPKALAGIKPPFIGSGAQVTLDLTWLLVGSRLGARSPCWDTLQNFGAECPVRGSATCHAQTRQQFTHQCLHPVEPARTR